MKNEKIDPLIFELYDEYCHSSMERREFFKQAAAITVAGGVTGLAMAQALLPQYASAQTISFTDSRIHSTYVNYDSSGGNSGKMRGYLVQPVGKGPFPAVLVVHENRGLNPYVEDVTRRAAAEGFLAFAPDALTPLGGYPGNDDDGKKLQASLDTNKIMIDMRNSANFLKSHPLSNGKLGATGFCFGGAVVNYLAVELGADLKVSVPFYGRAPAAEDVKKISAAMMIHYAEDDAGVNSTQADYKKALETKGADFEMHTYPGTQHGFHNNSTPRYNEKAAQLAWKRTIDAFKKHLI